LKGLRFLIKRQKIPFPIEYRALSLFRRIEGFLFLSIIGFAGEFFSLPFLLQNNRAAIKAKSVMPQLD
jgi:hypothetical protein